MKMESAYNPKTIIWEKGCNLKEHEMKQRIMVIGPGSPFKGGMANYTENLLSSELKSRYLLGHFDPLEIKNRNYNKKSHLSLKELSAAFRVIKTLIRAIRKFNPDLVHIHSSSYWGYYEKALMLLIVKIIFKKKVLLQIHGGEFDVFYQKSFFKTFIDRTIQYADKTLIVSKMFKEILCNDHISVVDGATRFDDRVLTVEKESLRDKYGIPKEKKVFLSIAMLEKRKHVYETLEAFKDVLECRSDFVFIIAGQGPDEERIRQFVNRHNLNNNVRFLDYIEGIEKEETLLLSDVFIFNSSNDSFGITLLEAVSHCLFVISTPVGIASDDDKVFNNENCIIIPINNNQALRNSIIAILDDTVDTDKIIRNNYFNFKKRFDNIPVFYNISTIYRHMLDIND